MKNIAVIGAGYVGLVTGTCFAETGNQVTCVDIDKKKVQQMKDGQVPIYEPHLDVLFERNLSDGRLHFTTDLADAVADAEIIFLALPTPPGEDGSADLSYVLNVASELGTIIKDYKVIVDKSTVPVGTAEKVWKKVSAETDVPFDVVSNPEFLREGYAVDDFMKPDRVIIGTESERAIKVMEELYKPFVRQGNPIMFMNEKSAELTKYASNAYLAMKITFMNEIANFCEAADADVDSVRLGVGSDTRIGSRFLFPGIGYGGSCFPKDVQALVKSGQELGTDFQIIQKVMEVNNQQKLTLVDKIQNYFGHDLKGVKIALWGLSFKPETDDIREAPAIYMTKALRKAGAHVVAYDPEAMENFRQQVEVDIEYAENQYEGLKDADALIIATEWSVFRNPDFEKIKDLLKEKVIFDGRNLYDLDSMKSKGFYYESIGRKIIHP